MVNLASLLQARQAANAAKAVTQEPVATSDSTPVVEKANPLFALLKKNQPTPPVPAQKLNFQEIMAKAKESAIDRTPQPEAETAYQNPADLNDIAESAEDEISVAELSGGYARDFMSAERLHIADAGIPYDESQVSAIKGLVQEQYGCLIGAAGTGKTTTTRKILDVLINGSVEWEIEPLRLAPVNLTEYHRADEGKGTEKEKAKDYIPSIVMAAFTGQATQVIKKNMPGQWAKNVMTIHSMLGYAPEETLNEDTGKVGMVFRPSYTAFNKMPWDIIIIDEASMVATDLWHEILVASKPSTRFYFIGDLNQLTPPIGQGILGFALAHWPTFELTEVHRQKDEAANKIVDAAWNVLLGQWPIFDDFSKDPNWRVAGMLLDSDPAKAHVQIVSLAKALSKERISPKVDPTTPIIYDPWRDRILTQGNGFDENKSSSLLGQYPLNESLSLTFADAGNPRFVIDAGINKKRFAVAYRVMATKNEPPNVIGRVTNGLTGKIQTIEVNPDWVGDHSQVGDEQVVRANHKEKLLRMLGKGEESEVTNAFADFSFDGMKRPENAAEEGRNSGPASHIVTVLFDNGTTRVYNTKAQVDQLMLAYASTVHKAQGAEMPTTIIVLHHAGNSRMLNRESLYTAITRASQRVVILHTDSGMRKSLARQEVFGNTLAEKIKQYIKMMGGEDRTGFKTINVKLTHDDLEADLFDEAAE